MNTRPDGVLGRIVYITETDLSLDNGPGINEREFVQAFRAAVGERLTCVVPYPEKPDNYYDSDIQYVLGHYGSPVRYIAHIIHTVLRVQALHRQHRFSAIVTRLGVLPFAPLILAISMRQPLIVKTLQGYVRFGGGIGAKRRLLHRLLLPVYRAAARRAMLADTPSHANLEWIHSFLGVARERLAIIRNGANTHLFCPGDRWEARRALQLEDFEYIIGYVGALSPLRNLEMLIKGYGKIASRHNVGLVLVGEGESREDLKRLATELGLSNRVRFLGSRPYSEVPRCVQAFDVGVDLTVVPMHVGSTTLAASFSQKIAQYLACGVPVVAWDVPDNYFLIDREIGKVVPYGDIDALGHALESILQLASSRREALSAAARLYAVSNLSQLQLVRQRLEWWETQLSSSAGSSVT